MEQGRINVSVANLYSLPGYSSEIVSQALLGEAVTVLEREKSFARVRLADGYEGWLSNYQWVVYADSKFGQQRVRTHFLQIFENPDTLSRPLRDAVIGTLLPIVARQGEWVEVILPDGIKGYVPGRCFAPFPVCSRAAVVQLAHEFLGYPYHWGGRSPRGFDCSGFVQTVFSLLNVSLPRDSWMQHRDGRPVNIPQREAQAGDLYFFAEKPGKISHVGIALGRGKIIHARGMVRINSLSEIDPDFMPDLAETFVDIRTYIE